MDKSEEVLKLVRTVGDLPREDQSRILRIVDLLSHAPSPVQKRTQRMLRDLIDAEPESKLECVAGVDEVIEYLENAVLDEPDTAAAWARFDQFFARSTTQ
jgi:prophage DNA circulation protein